MLFTSNKYRKYGNNVIDCGEEYVDAANKLIKNIEKTVPSEFSGRSAQRAVLLASEIATGLDTSGRKLTNIGYSIRSIANNNDVD